tara:strand:+ start:7734 stop:7928 length:195 start_codon:yes stop_codon:yes gene_type:complete
MENPLMHLLHAAVITLLVYIILKFLLKQSQGRALNRSLVFGLLAALYMVLFGHGPPTRLNRNLL